MTSGTFSTVPLSSIWVDRAKRQRRELRDIDSLAASISAIGLIHPPVIRRSGELVVGERRFTALKALGWTDIPIQYIEELGEEELKKVELEENVRRSDLTWQETCLAVADYHALRAKESKDWSAVQTGEALGFTSKHISEQLRVAKEIKNENPLVKAAPKYSTAVNITERKLDREKKAAIQSIPTVGVEEAKPAKPAAPLLHADFSQWAKNYAGPRFNLIHCDFPYGVGMHKTDQGGARFEHGSYEDTPDVYYYLLQVLADSMANVVDEAAHLMFWFSMDFYTNTKIVLEKMGWTVNPFPLIWLKDDNTGIIPDPNRGPRRIYETAFLATRGDLKIVRPVSNAFAAPGRGKTIHMNEKPQAMLRHFLGMLVSDTTRLLDPTCGSASAVKAAKALGAFDVLGIEQNEEFFNLAKEAFFDD